MRAHFWSILKNAPMAICLVVSAIVVTIWLRSYIVSDRYRWIDLDESSPRAVWRNAVVSTGMGGVGFFYEYTSSADPAQLNRMHWRMAGSPPGAGAGYQSRLSPRYPMRMNVDDGLLANLGINFRNASYESEITRQRQFALTLPFWAVCAVTAAYPIGSYIAGVIRRQREDRLALGLCPRCGMALKGGEQRCPCCAKPLAIVREARSPA